MKHHKTIRKFGRERDQRVALLRSLARSLILHEKIKTTEARAKELRPFVEKLITKSKTDTLAARRLVTADLGNQLVTMRKLFTTLGPRFKERHGGYTRVTKLGRSGDDARAMAQIEFTA
jgi:large subunit ribosomal protein L17